MTLAKLSRNPITIFSIMTELSRKYGAINLSQGFPDMLPPESLRKCVEARLHTSPLVHQYAPMPGILRLRIAVSQLLKETLGIDAPDPETQITITSGATQAIYTVLATYLHAGDEMIVFAPAYDSYVPGGQLHQARVREVPCHPPEWEPDWDRLEDLLTERTRVIVVNTPHNPATGVWKQQWWNTLAEILLRRFPEPYLPRIVSDEVYAWMTFDGESHVSVLHHPILRNVAFACYSFGKMFHATGWKLGFVVSASADRMEEFRKSHQYVVFSSCTLLQEAIADFLEKEEGRLYVRSLSAFFQRKRDRFLEGLRSAGVPFQWLIPRGTYFLLADYSSFAPEMDDMTFARWLTKEARVSAIPLSPFFQDPPPHLRLIRFCFAKEDSTLDEAIELLAQIHQLSPNLS